MQNPDAIVEELWVFRHWVVAKTSVVSIPDAGPEGLCCGRSDLSDWLHKPVREVVPAGMTSRDAVRRAAAMACLNGCIRPAKSMYEGNSIIPFAQMVRNVPTCFIGHFQEAERWRSLGYPVTIVELLPRKGDVHWLDADEQLAQCRIVFITGLTLLNDTFEQVIGRTPNARIRVLLGPTVPPTAALLECGVHVVGGTKVVHFEKLLKYFQYGGTSIKNVPAGVIERFNIVHPGLQLKMQNVA